MDYTHIYNTYRLLTYYECFYTHISMKNSIKQKSNLYQVRQCNRNQGFWERIYCSPSLSPSIHPSIHPFQRHDTTRHNPTSSHQKIAHVLMPSGISLCARIFFCLFNLLGLEPKVQPIMVLVLALHSQHTSKTAQQHMKINSNNTNYRYSYRYPLPVIRYQL